MRKRLLSLPLCLSMVLSLCVSTSAAGASDETALKSAIAQGTDVQLLTDITLSKPFTVEKSMSLDLNGRTLTYTGTGGSIITVKQGGGLFGPDAALYAGADHDLSVARLLEPDCHK